MMSRYLIAFLILGTIFLIFQSCTEPEKKQSLEEVVINLDSLYYEKGTDKLFTGRHKGEADGKIIEYDVVEGKKHGEFIIKTKEGNPVLSGQMENNRNTGTWKYYYPNGNIESTGEFRNDLPEGEWKWFYDSGELMEKGTFTGGVKSGTWYRYDGNGNVITVIDQDSINSVKKKRNNEKD